MNHPLLLGSYVALWLLVLGLFPAVFLLYYHYGKNPNISSLQRDLQGPKLNKAVAPHPVLDVNHRQFQLGRGTNGAFQVVLFGVSLKAGSEFHAQLAKSVEHSKGLVETVLVVPADADTQEFQALSEKAVIVADREMKAFRRWNVQQRSFVVLLDNQGIVRLKGLVSTAKSLRELYARCGIPEELEERTHGV